MKARDFLINLGLAKQGRGRFSREAKAALDQAIRNGENFSDYNIAVNVVTKVRHVDENTDAIENWEMPKHFPAIISRPMVRENDYFFGIDKELKCVIALHYCYKCFHNPKFCACDAGPQLPAWLGGGTGLLERPNEI